MVLALVAGALAGLVSFGIQHFAVVPLIQQAETYESAAHTAEGVHEDEGWQPAEGWQRTSLTALATILTGIGYAAVLFGIANLSSKPINLKRGALLGVAAFACVALAPALGLPPQPPGVPLADLHDRQLWWLGTALVTALGLWLIFRSKPSWAARIAGVVCLAAPHFIGAPVNPPNTTVPLKLVYAFEAASLLTTGTFWLLLGAAGGFLQDRLQSGKTLLSPQDRLR